MRFFGLNISREKAALPPTAGYGTGGWWPIVREPFTGAWQRNQELRQETTLTYHAVYSCVTLIAQDVAKIRIRLVQQDANGIWTETYSPSFSPVLRKPNRYQNRIKFFEQWVISKLTEGNAYILKERDNRKVVSSLYVLDPYRTKPLVTPDGSVFYQLSRDDLSGVKDASVIVPASEIIHDTMVPLYHPLCGVSPITSCNLAAWQGMAIQRNAARFFKNGSNPGGLLTAPGQISEPTAARLKAHWEENYSGENTGRVAVLGDGLKYERMSVNAVDAQLIEQLKLTAEMVCSSFHVPSYMVNVGPAPTYNNIEALSQQYYSQCLQTIFENIELCLDEGLGVVDVPGQSYGTEFDLDDLLRMDTATQVKTLADGVRGGLYKPDEGRKKLGLPPTEGGDQVYLQEQNYSLAALAKRDALANPFGAKTPAAPTAAAQPPALASPPTPKMIEFAGKSGEDEPSDDDLAETAMRMELELQPQLLRAAA